MLGADILGSVYEQFLGKVIRLTEGHHAKIEEKPEVKKAGGVYYTPTYIVEYIVKHTVGKLVEGKTPKKVEKPAHPRSRLRLRLVPDRRVSIPARLAPRLVREGRRGETRQRQAAETLAGQGRGMAAYDRRAQAHPHQQHLRRGHRLAGRGSHETFAPAQGARRRVRPDLADQAIPRARAARPRTQHQVRQLAHRAGFLRAAQSLSWTTTTARASTSSTGTRNFPRLWKQAGSMP